MYDRMAYVCTAAATEVAMLFQLSAAAHSVDVTWTREGDRIRDARK